MGLSGRAPTPNRWRIAIASAIVMLTTGTVYSWGIFTQPLLVAFRWDLTVTTWTYAIANFSLGAIGVLIGGFWQDRVGPRIVTMAGITLWGSGNVLAGLGTPALGASWLYLTYGVIGGIGAGMAYITPLSMITKWFPDKKGLAGGFVAGGFGLGAFVYTQLVPRLAGFHAAAVHAGGFIAASNAAKIAGTPFDPAALLPEQTPTAGDIHAVMRVLVGSGVIFLIVGLAAASQLRNPAPDYSPPGYRHGLALRRMSSGVVSYSPSQIIATPQFYLLWLQLFVNVIAGIAIISNAVFILADLTGLAAVTIAPLFGLVSIFNALGRIFWGTLSDRIGCNNTFAAMLGVQAAVLFLLPDIHNLTLALAAVSVILLCCGGGFGTMPSFNAEYFGTKFMGLNYGLIVTAWGFAGLVGPILVAKIKDLTGSFTATLPVFAVLLLAAMIIPFVTAKPALRTA
jgi:MFS transporter, OFA family, oxalate/formate antiporter